MIGKYRNIRKHRFLGYQIENDPVFLHAKQMTLIEDQKTTLRSEVINFLLSLFDENNSTYLEIGVRNPSDNFDKIKCKQKYSVDPGIEYEPNPVNFKMSSDDFFDQLAQGKILSKSIKFDVIFIDGLHTASQAIKDINNSLLFLSEKGFVVVHDCNPPTEYHAREDHNFNLSPALNNWNGTTWKAFYATRLNKNVSTCCIDSDWGIGVISPKEQFGFLSENINPFYEFQVFDKYRTKSLNLMTFDEFKNKVKENK